MKRFCTYIVMIGLVSGCLEEIPFQVENDPEQQLVVDGGLNADNKIHKITLSWTGKVEGENPFQPAEGAIIQVSDGSNAYHFVESENDPGRYYSDTIDVDISKTYILTIDLNGERYEAEAGAVPSKSFDPIEYYPSEGGGPILGDNPQGFYAIEFPGNFGGGEPYLYFLEFEVPKDWKDDFPYPIPPGYIDWNYHGPYDTTYLVHPTIETAALFEYGESVTDGLPLGTKFREKRYYLAQDYYRFLRAILMETEWRGSNIMQSVPANVPTNLSNGALGYFYVYESYEVISYIEEE